MKIISDGKTANQVAYVFKLTIVLILQKEEKLKSFLLLELSKLSTFVNLINFFQGLLKDNIKIKNFSSIVRSQIIFITLQEKKKSLIVSV